MPYIIDGHNLIPKVPGLSLADIDDEMRLVGILQEFCRTQRKQVEVFFDKAAPGGVRAQKFGCVTARFVSRGRTADAAIRERLIRLGGEARNYFVVSSDRAVQASARSARARVLSSDEFAGSLLSKVIDRPEESGALEDVPVSEDEIDEWLELFDADEQ
jgi:hypothetical protein